jgi:hypothetical protein
MTFYSGCIMLCPCPARSPSLPNTQVLRRSLAAGKSIFVCPGGVQECVAADLLVLPLLLHWRSAACCCC